MTNATLQRVDSPPATGPGGDLAPYTAGAALAVRCVLDRPSFLVQRLIDQLKLESTAVLFVKMADMPTAATALLRNCQVLLQQDGMLAQLYQIDDARPAVFGGLTHVQCLLRVA